MNFRNNLRSGDRMYVFKAIPNVYFDETMQIAVSYYLGYFFDVSLSDGEIIFI